MDATNAAVDGARAVGASFQGDKVRLNVWIKRSVYDGLNDIAVAEDMSVSDVARNAFKDYIRRYKTRTKIEKE